MHIQYNIPARARGLTSVQLFLRLFILNYRYPLSFAIIIRRRGYWEKLLHGFEQRFQRCEVRLQCIVELTTKVTAGRPVVLVDKVGERASALKRHIVFCHLLWWFDSCSGCIPP